MKNSIPYKHEESVRTKYAIFLVVLSFFGSMLFLFELNIIIIIIIGHLMAVGSYFLFKLIRGGHNMIEITDDGVCWECPGQEKRMIRHNEVDSFELISDYHLISVRLKSGDKIIMPEIGDPRPLHNILMQKWKYLGRDSEDIRTSVVGSVDWSPAPSQERGRVFQAHRTLMGFGAKIAMIPFVFILWLFARLIGLSVGIWELLIIHFQGSDYIDITVVMDIIGVLFDAKEAGFIVSTDEVKQAYAKSINPHEILVAMINARRFGMNMSFGDVLRVFSDIHEQKEKEAETQSPEVSLKQLKDANSEERKEGTG